MTSPFQMDTAEHKPGDVENREVYLRRMDASLREKIRVIWEYLEDLKDEPIKVLDVGCANGTVTRALAQLMPNAEFLGIDLSRDFVDAANQAAADQPNVHFREMYLSQAVAEPDRYDVVLFCSVLHEFYSYGQGISSVVKALGNAHELLVENGMIVIRDMILARYTRKSQQHVPSIREKLAGFCPDKLADFENHYGPIVSIADVNHLLLKYFYTENWRHELPEHYVPVLREWYEQQLEMLDMQVAANEQELLPWLRKRWQKDLGLTDRELRPLRSTGIIQALKVERSDKAHR